MIRAFLEGSEEAWRRPPVHRNAIETRKPRWMPTHLAHRGIWVSPKEYDLSAIWWQTDEPRNIRRLSSESICDWNGLRWN
jgi:hypothetical protein